MWLLNTRTLKLQYFLGKVPKYAILSHRWQENEELTFGDITEASIHLSGYHKAKKFCEIAASEGFDYGWIDTCCIDKKSSAELSEAINSMYRWYRDSAVCYAYLMDVDDVFGIGRSSWFDRGWTLQELIAPFELEFYSCHWKRLGTKRDLSDELEDRTGIPRPALLRFDTSDYNIAYKMSWAANRQTTREEDQAYSLLGLFNVNMPLLYGEGCNAFQRLQEEIMKSATDISIFLWSGLSNTRFGMLAFAPSSFPDHEGGPRSLNRFKASLAPTSLEGWTINNAGIQLTALLLPYAFSTSHQKVFILFWGSENWLGEEGIFVVHDSNSKQVSRFTRVSVNGQTWTDVRWDPGCRVEPQSVLIMRKPLEKHTMFDPPSFRLHSDLLGSFGKWVFQKSDEQGRCHWPHEVPTHLSEGLQVHHIIFEPGRMDDILAILAVQEHGIDRPILFLGIGFDTNFNTICMVLPAAEADWRGGWNLDPVRESLLAAFKRAMKDRTDGDQNVPDGRFIGTTRSDPVTGYLAYMGNGPYIRDDEGLVYVRILDWTHSIASGHFVTVDMSRWPAFRAKFAKSKIPRSTSIPAWNRLRSKTGSDD